ncbi:MAG: hypothetical protein ACYDGN_16095 [Acidimicrobiales bacterium]
MSVTTVEVVPGPDPEVRPAHQVYPAAYKLKVLTSGHDAVAARDCCAAG